MARHYAEYGFGEERGDRREREYGREAERDDDAIGQREAFGRAGRSNYGSSRYGGSDYVSNDYNRNESRYGTPYSETSNRRQFEDRSENEYRGGARVMRGDWTRSRGSGEWNDAPLSTDYDEPYGFLYGEASYGYNTDRDYGRDRYETGRFGSERRDFCGVGPKGYQRSDDRLKEIICEALTEAPHIDAREIEVEVDNGAVKLSGSVPDRRTKYAAEDLIERRTGISEIRDELRVRDRSEWQSGARSRSSAQSNAPMTGQSGASQSASPRNTANEEDARESMKRGKGEQTKSQSGGSQSRRGSRGA